MASRRAAPSRKLSSSLDGISLRDRMAAFSCKAKDDIPENSVKLTQDAEVPDAVSEKRMDSVQPREETVVCPNGRTMLSCTDAVKKTDPVSSVETAKSLPIESQKTYKARSKVSGDSNSSSNCQGSVMAADLQSSGIYNKASIAEGPHARAKGNFSLKNCDLDLSTSFQDINGPSALKNGKDKIDKSNLSASVVSKTHITRSHKNKDDEKKNVLAECSDSDGSLALEHIVYSFDLDLINKTLSGEACSGSVEDSQERERRTDQPPQAPRHTRSASFLQKSNVSVSSDEGGSFRLESSDDNMLLHEETNESLRRQRNKLDEAGGSDPDSESASEESTVSFQSSAIIQGYSSVSNNFGFVEESDVDDNDTDSQSSSNENHESLCRNSFGASKGISAGTNECNQQNAVKAINHVSADSNLASNSESEDVDDSNYLSQSMESPQDNAESPPTDNKQERNDESDSFGGNHEVFLTSFDEQRRLALARNRNAPKRNSSKSLQGAGSLADRMKAFTSMR